MKKVIGIFLTMVLVAVFVSMALADYDEVKSFCLDHFYLKKFVTEDGGHHYNIIDDEAYIISDFGDWFGTMDNFMDKYVSEYLAPEWPEFVNDVDVEYYTLVQDSENYEYLIVELKLNNGKLMSDYLDGEPAVSRITGIIPFKKTDK